MGHALRAYLALRSALRPVRSRARGLGGAVLQSLTEMRWRSYVSQRPHTLASELIVSVTSYPPRFPTLALTLKCLLMQSVRPDRVVLWVASADAPMLPPEVTWLRAAGLEIRTCRDLGPYKKIVPALQAWPHAFVATADDDVYYPYDWLCGLTCAYREHERVIPCHRAHHIALRADGRAPGPYSDWRQPARPGETSPLVFPTGVGGVLYPPGCLHSDATRDDLFAKLSPFSDDAWLYWMARLNGWRFKRVSARQFVCWPGSQRIALQTQNVAGGNDLQIDNLCGHYGFVLASTPTFSPSVKAVQW